MRSTWAHLGAMALETLRSAQYDTVPVPWSQTIDVWLRTFEALRAGHSGLAPAAGYLKRLNLLFDEDLLTTGSSLTCSHPVTSAKHSILLPIGHHMVDLHEQNTGTTEAKMDNNTLNTMRRRFWIISGKAAVK